MRRGSRGCAISSSIKERAASSACPGSAIRLMRPCATGLLGREEPSGEDPLLGQADPDVLQQTEGPSRSGQDAEPDLGEAHECRRVGDPKVAGEREFPPAPEGVAVQRRDRGERQRFEILQDALHETVERGEGGPIGEFADVGAGCERPVACPRQDHAPRPPGPR